MLKRVLRSVLCLTFSLHTFSVYGYPSSPETHATSRAYKALANQKTWNGFLKATQKTFSPELHALLKSKTARLKTAPPKIVRINGSTFQVQSNQQVTTIEVLNASQKKFMINQHLVQITGEDSAQVIWDKVQATFPKQSQFNRFGLFLPQAHADFGLTTFIAIGVTIVVVGVVGFVVAYNHCDPILKHATECEAATSTTEALALAQSAVNEIRPLIGCHAEKDRVNACFRKLQMRVTPATPEASGANGVK